MYQQDQKSLLRKADELIDNRDYDRALSILGDLGSNGLEPEIDIEVRFLTGSAYYERSDYDDALPHLQAVAAGPPEHPDRPEALLLLGYIAIFKAFDADEEGDSEGFTANIRRALPHFKTFETEYPDRPDISEAYGRIGQCHLELDNLRTAIDYYWRAKENCGEDELVGFYLRKLGTIYQDLEEYDTAQELLTQSLQHPDTPNGRGQALSNLGRIALFVDDDPELAMKLFSEALELFDSQAEDYVSASHDHALYGMGEVLLDAGEVDTARYYFERVIVMDNPHTGNAELAAEALLETTTTRH